MEGFFDDIIDSIRKNGRVEELRQIARLNNFEFKNREKFTQQDYLLKVFSIFKGKKPKRFKGILKKKETTLDAKIRIYDYWYFGDLKKRKTTIYEFFVEAFDLPKFEIRPKGILNQVTDIFLSKEKPFPKNTQFHSKFEIITDDAFHFESEISETALNFLLDKKNISVEGEGDYLLVYHTYQTTPAKYITTEYDSVLDFVEIILKDDSNQYV